MLSSSLRVVLPGLEVFPSLKGLDLLWSVQPPERPLFEKEGRLPSKEDDDVKEFLPVVAERVRGHVRRKVKVRPRDDVEVLAVVAEHL
jgi:hypothetical protein